MTNQALDLAKVFRFWWTIDQNMNGPTQLARTREHIGEAHVDVLSYLSNLLSGVDRQISELEAAQAPIDHFREVQKLWIDAVFMREVGWGGANRNPSIAIGKSSVVALESLGYAHAQMNMFNKLPSSLFVALAQDLEAVQQELVGTQVPQIMKTIVDSKISSLRLLLLEPHVNPELVLTRFSELIGLLTFAMSQLKDDETSRSFKAKAQAWIKKVTNETAVSFTAGVLVTLANQNAPLLLGS